MSDDVLVPVEIEDLNLVHTVNTLLNDETGEEAQPSSDESQKTKILTVLDDPKEMKKGSQKELNSMREMGAMTAVKRTGAVGVRVIQTRWIDREKDGRVNSRLVLTSSIETTVALSPRCLHRHRRHCPRKQCWL